MPSEKEDFYPEGFARFDLETFKSISLDLIDAYDKGFLSLILAGPRVSGFLPSSIKQLLIKKHGIERELFDSVATGLLISIHTILSDEVDEQIEDLKKNKGEEVASGFKEKISFVKEIIEKNPEIRQGYFTYTSAILGIYEKVEWEASLKAFQSTEFTRGEDIPVFPSAKIRIVLRTSAPRRTDTRLESVEFDISTKDLDNMITSLQELKEAMDRLKIKKLV